MKIVQVLPELNQGGVERGTVELSRELVRRGHQSIVISAGGKLSGQIELDGGEHFTMDVCGKNPLNAPWRVRQLKNLIRKIDPDIVHARSRVPAWLCVFALRGMKIPFVTTVHGFNSVNFYSKVMTRGQRVICVSNSVKDYIRTNYDTPEEKIRIVHRGIDTEEFSPEKLDNGFIESFKNQHSLAGKYTVLSVGRITPLKNFEAFIKAIRICSESMPDIKGIIVGGARKDKEAHFVELKKLVTDLGMQDSIAFAGPQEKMAEIYSLSDLLVTCSRKPESFGRSLLEAMAMETAAISKAWGGPLDIIEDGHTGLFFEDNEPEKIAQTISKARQTTFSGLREYVIDKFSLETMVEKELAVYSELL